MRLWILAVALLLWCVPSPAATARKKTGKPAHHAFQATAYSIKGVTQSGARARSGVVAADPRVLPKGSVVDVKGAGRYSGRYKVADTGSSVKGRKIDIYVPNPAHARK